MSVAASETNIREELWRSFASMLSSYASIQPGTSAKLSVAQEEHAIVVRSSGSSMQLTLSRQDGAGLARFKTFGAADSIQHFALHMDGTITLADSDWPLDIAAHELLNRFVEHLRKAEEMANALLLVAIL